MYPVTENGFRNLTANHKNLLQQRLDIAEKINEARMQDSNVDENSLYDMLRVEQAQLEVKISALEDKLSRAKIVDITNLKKDKIYFGSQFKIINVDTDIEQQLQIVSEDESNIQCRKISNTSPLGKSLIGKEKGDSVFVDTPKGEVEYVIIDIT